MRACCAYAGVATTSFEAARSLQLQVPTLDTFRLLSFVGQGSASAMLGMMIGSESNTAVLGNEGGEGRSGGAWRVEGDARGQRARRAADRALCRAVGHMDHIHAR